MQRQSLGSPGRERLSLSNNDTVVSSHHLDDHHKQRRESSPPSSISDEIKPEKPHKCRYPQPENLIHLIPALILFCFLVLYLSSHDPSPQDMAQFHGFTNPQQIAEIDEEIDNSINKVLRRSKAFVIRSLQEEKIIQSDDDDDTTTTTKSTPRSHRKLADF